MSANIRYMVFFEQMLEDGEIYPDSGDKHFQEDDGELSDDASQFTNKNIDGTEYHDIYENLAYLTSNEEPPEQITEGFKTQSKLASQLLKIPSPIKSPKMFFHA